jgi:BMFP domain-containing protein YqiC
MARLAREENEALKARIAALEAKGEKPAKKTAAPPAK